MSETSALRLSSPNLDRAKLNNLMYQPQPLGKTACRRTSLEISEHSFAFALITRIRIVSTRPTSAGSGVKALTL